MPSRTRTVNSKSGAFQRISPAGSEENYHESSTGSSLVHKINQTPMDGQDPSASTESRTTLSPAVRKLEILRKTHAELLNYYTLLRLVRSDLENITQNFASISNSIMHPRLEDLGALSPLASSLRRRSRTTRAVAVGVFTPSESMMQRMTTRWSASSVVWRTISLKL